MPKMAVIDLVTGEVRGVIVASPGDPPHRGTRLIQIHDKAHIDTRFTWSEREGFQPNQEYSDKIAVKVAEPSWQLDSPGMTVEWDSTQLTFVHKEIV